MTALSAYQLSKTFKKGERTLHALSECSLEIEAGRFMAILGPNGAGKSTLLRCALGLVAPDAGHISVLGSDPLKDRRVQARVGSVLEGNRGLHWRLTAEENLIYAAALKSYPSRRARARVKAMLEAIGLADKSRSPVSSLSRGMQQRLAFVASMVHEPRLLLLDEPSLGLDVDSLRALKILLRAAVADGAAVVLTTHHLELAEDLADEITLLSSGRVVGRGAPAEIVEQYARNTYVIEMIDAIPDSVVMIITGKGLASVDGRQLVVRGGSGALYECLAHLQPMPIKRVLHASESLSSALQTFFSRDLEDAIS